MADRNSNVWPAWQGRNLADNDGDMSLQQQRPSGLNGFNLQRQAYVDREKQRSEELVQAMGNHPSYLTYALEVAHKEKAAQITQGTQVRETVNNTTYTTVGTPSWSPRGLGHTQEDNSAAETDSNKDFQNVREQYAHWPTMIGNDKMPYPSIEQLLQEQLLLRQQETQNTTQPWSAQRQPHAQATSSQMNVAYTTTTRMPTSGNSHFFDPNFGRNNTNNNACSDKANAGLSNNGQKLVPEIRPRIDASMAALRAPLQQWSEGKVAHNSSHLDSVRNSTANKTPTAATYGDDATTPKATQRPSSVARQWTLPYSIGNGSTGINTNTSITHTRVPSPNKEPLRLSLKSLVLDSLDNVDSHEENTLHDDSNKEEPHGAVSKQTD